MVFIEISALLDVESLRKIGHLKRLIRTFKHSNGLKVEENSGRFYLNGSLKGIISFKDACEKQAVEADPDDIYVRTTSIDGTKEIEAFFDGKTLGTSSAKTVSSCNISLGPAKFCYLLLTKRQDVEKQLSKYASKLKLKEISSDRVRIKLDNTTDCPLDKILKEMSTSNMEGTQSISIQIPNLKTPSQFLDEIMDTIKPILVLLIRDKETSRWQFHAVVSEDGHTEAKTSCDKVIENLADEKEESVEDILKNESTSKRTREDKIESNGRVFQNSSDRKVDRGYPLSEQKHTAVDNDEHIKESLTYASSFEATPVYDNQLTERQVPSIRMAEERMEEPKGPAMKPKFGIPATTTESKEINIYDGNLVDYIVQFKQSELSELKKQHHFELGFEKKDEGTIVMKSNGALSKNAESSLTHFVQNIVQDIDFKEVDITSIGRTAFFDRQGEVVSMVDNYECCLKVDQTNMVLIFGPREKIQECVTAIKTILRLTTKRRALSNPTTPQPSFDDTPRFPLSGSVTSQMYLSADTKTKVFVWMADITKLNVCAVVNAANEYLDHGAGVARAIADAAGPDLERECKTRVRTLGPLPYSEVCVTTAGRMPSQMVIHTVGPMWNVCTPEEFRHRLSKAFTNCLEEALAKRCHSIALPAISSGIFGGPKTIVANEAVKSIVSFCSQHRYSTLNAIHLVDVLPDTVRCFQTELDVYVKKRLFTVDSNSKIFDKWLDAAVSTTSTQDFSNETNSYSPHESTISRSSNTYGMRDSGDELYTSDEDDDSKTGASASVKPKNSRNRNSKLMTSENTSTMSRTKETKEICTICMDTPTRPKTLSKCNHTFCTQCIDECFKKMQPKCPVCSTVYGKITGNQPKNGKMKETNYQSSLPGHPHCGTIEIFYDFPNGKQSEEHPHPGKPYYGTTRRAFLPDHADGRKVLRLLRKAFDARMVFTIGQSSTTGADDSVIWNCIHHKTRQTGGPQNYGYPDPTYLKRVTEELAAQGFD